MNYHKMALCLLYICCLLPMVLAVYMVKNLDTTGKVVKFKSKKNEPRVFCYDAGEDTWDITQISSIFEEVTIHVKESQSLPVPWHSIKGVSTDDLHAHLEFLVFKAFGKADQLQEKKPYEVGGFLRDIASACPSPMFGASRSACNMKFSTFGKGCVTVDVDSDHTFDVSVSRSLNHQLVTNLIAGLVLLFGATYLAKSKIFQYSTGSLAFMVGGILIFILIALNRMLGKRGSSYSKEIGLVLLITGGYGASVVYFLKENWQRLVLNYWEWVLGYLVIFALLGLGFIRFLRGNEQRKHSVTVMVKWLIRLAGIVTVYNASASPLGSLILIGTLVVVYILYAANKWIFARLFRKKSSDSATKKLK